MQEHCWKRQFASIAGDAVLLEQFLTLLINSRLISYPDARDLVAAFQEGCRAKNFDATADLFGEFLVTTSRLTAWQCDKLRKGKWKGFYLDDFLLLDQIGKDIESSSYKARDCRDGRTVILAITPVNSTNGRIVYRVEPHSE